MAVGDHRFAGRVGVRGGRDAASGRCGGRAAATWHSSGCVVASYLLSESLFQDRLRASGADVVTEPLGTHPGLVRLIANRFSRARYSVAV